jgi:hypothetical protein
MLGWLEGPPGQSFEFEAGDETIVPERPADAFRGAQPIEQVGVRGGLSSRSAKVYGVSWMHCHRSYESTSGYSNGVHA